MVDLFLDIPSRLEHRLAKCRLRSRDVRVLGAGWPSSILYCPNDACSWMLSLRGSSVGKKGAAATPRAAQAPLRGYRIEGPFREDPEPRLRKALAAGILVEYDDGRGASVWFCGPAGEELQALKKEIEKARKR